VLLQGTFGAVGELGHCVTGYTDALCACGRRGCLETLGSGRGIRRRAGHILGRSADTMSLAATERLNKIDAMLAAAAHQLGIGASWLVNLPNPAVVLLGGTDFAADADGFLRDFRASLEAHSLSAGNHRLNVQFAGTQADVWGATTAAIELLPPQLRPRILYTVQ
jgi:predicted NBD/HSP70 family sugar kinase